MTSSQLTTVKKVCSDVIRSIDSDWLEVMWSALKYRETSRDSRGMMIVLIDIADVELIVFPVQTAQPKNIFQRSRKGIDILFRTLAGQHSPSWWISSLPGTGKSLCSTWSPDTGHVASGECPSTWGFLWWHPVRGLAGLSETWVVADIPGLAKLEQLEELGLFLTLRLMAVLQDTSGLGTRNTGLRNLLSDSGIVLFSHLWLAYWHPPGELSACIAGMAVILGPCNRVENSFHGNMPTLPMWLPACTCSVRLCVWMPPLLLGLLWWETWLGLVGLLLQTENLL